MKKLFVEKSDHNFDDQDYNVDDDIDMADEATESDLLELRSLLPSIISNLNKNLVN